MGAAWRCLRPLEPLARVRAHQLSPPRGVRPVLTPRFALHLWRRSPSAPRLIPRAHVQALARFLAACPLPDPRSAQFRTRFECEFRRGGTLSTSANDYRAFLVTACLHSPHLPRGVRRALILALATEGSPAPPQGALWRLAGRLWAYLTSPSPPLSARLLRLAPPLTPTSPRLDRAHILSLSLTCTLWPLVHGPGPIHPRDLQDLRLALAQPANCRVTCRFANRVLHVRYDREIAVRLRAGPVALSPGARQRLVQIITSLRVIEHDGPRNIADFARRARLKLQQC